MVRNRSRIGKFVVLFLFTFYCAKIADAAMIIDHSSVDLYDDIPAEYFTEAKKMWLNIPGESHSSGYRKGVTLLNQFDSKYIAIAVDSGSPTVYTIDALRVSGLNRTQYNSWSQGAGESKWYCDINQRSLIKNHMTYANNNGYNLAVVGFGWCWDMTWHSLGSVNIIDPVYGVHWFGSSDGGPEGDLRWGLDAGDTALTANSINMDTYIKATEEYNNFAITNGYKTRVMFTTGPVDSYSGEMGYQRHIKHQYIRNYVNNRQDAILFDYADILAWNNSGQQNLQTYNNNSYQMIHTDNMRDYDANWNTIPHTEDGDHIGEVGAMRLGKALWVLAARLAGWNPDNSENPEDPENSGSDAPKPPSGLIAR